MLPRSKLPIFHLYEVASYHSFGMVLLSIRPDARVARWDDISLYFFGAHVSLFDSRYYLRPQDCRINYSLEKVLFFFGDIALIRDASLFVEGLRRS